MMTSDPHFDPHEAFVWIWLPGASAPVVCGRLDDDGGRISFTYARSYLGRADAVPIYEPELPLKSGPQFAASGVGLPLCLADASPDAWGRRLIHHRLQAGTGEFSELTYLLESGSDRIGAVDVQGHADRYERGSLESVTLNDLANAAHHIETGEALHPILEAALLHGTSIGGARPKASLFDGSRLLIAKFASSHDLYPVVQGEFLAMTLARRAGLDVAGVSLTRAAGRHALLVDRFDRDATGARRRMVSALTVLGLAPFPEGRYATYVDIAHKVREYSRHPDATLRELYARIVFNVLCSNTDDHGRNHAFLIDTDGLVLSPAYDICPQARTARDANQAMAYDSFGNRSSKLKPLIAAAATYHLDRGEAQSIVDSQIATIHDAWDEMCDKAELTQLQRQAFFGRQFLNPGLHDELG
jgi:serine/threonine-protein kinase HipA